MCDSMCAIQGGRGLFAKNSDRPLSEIQVIERHPPRPAGGTLRTTYLEIPDAGAAALIGARPAWGWGLEHGVNEHGLAIGNEQVWTVDDPDALPEALTGMDLVRLGLEQARTADDALEIMTGLIQEHGQGGITNRADDDAYFSSFLVTDARGGWVLETSGRTWAARPVAEADVISNRLSIRTEWTRASADVEAGTDFDRWRDQEMWTGLAERRLLTTRAGVVDRSGVVGPADLVAVLRHHGDRLWGRPGAAVDPAEEADPPPPGPGFDPSTGEGFTVCSHLRSYQSTTSSMVAELPADPALLVRAWVAPASPCVSVFVPVFLPDAIPPELADPATFARFATLARRVESDPDQLAVIRGVLGPVETDLWSEAETIEDPDRAARFAAACWAPVDAALRQL